jgi:uncharacterized membrane protein
MLENKAFLQHSSEWLIAHASAGCFFTIAAGSGENFLVKERKLTRASHDDIASALRRCSRVVVNLLRATGDAKERAHSLRGG